MHGKHTMCDSLSVGVFLLSHSYTSQFVMVSHYHGWPSFDGCLYGTARMQCCSCWLMNRITTLFLLPSYTMHTQTYTIHTTHSEPTMLEFNLISSLRRVTLFLHFSVIEHEIFLAKKKWHHRILKIELSFLSRKQLVLGITHAVKINTAVSTGSTYCPPPSYVSLLRSWSEILGCKVGPHFV